MSIALTKGADCPDGRCQFAVHPDGVSRRQGCKHVVDFLPIEFEPMADARRIGLIAGEQADTDTKLRRVQFAVIADVDRITQAKIDERRAGVERDECDIDSRALAPMDGARGYRGDRRGCWRVGGFFPTCWRGRRRSL